MISKLILLIIGIIIVISICNAYEDCDCSKSVKNSTLPDLIISVKVEGFNLSFAEAITILPEEKDIF